MSLEANGGLSQDHSSRANGGHITSSQDVNNCCLYVRELLYVREEHHGQWRPYYRPLPVSPFVRLEIMVDLSYSYFA